MDSERTLYDAASEPLKKIQARTKHNPHLAPLFVTHLTTGNGTLFFDRATKTKTVEEQLMVAENSGMLKIVRHFEKLLSRPGAEDERSADSIRQNLADFLLNSARNRTKRNVEAVTVTSTEEWLLSLLAVFSRFAYCLPRPHTESRTRPDPAISSSSRTMFQSRISSLLAHLLSSTPQAQSCLPELVVDNVREGAAAVGLRHQANGRRRQAGPAGGHRGAEDRQGQGGAVHRLRARLPIGRGNTPGALRVFVDAHTLRRG